MTKEVYTGPDHHGLPHQAAPAFASKGWALFEIAFPVAPKTMVFLNYPLFKATKTIPFKPYGYQFIWKTPAVPNQPPTCTHPKTSSACISSGEEWCGSCGSRPATSGACGSGCEIHLSLSTPKDYHLLKSADPSSLWGGARLGSCCRRLWSNGGGLDDGDSSTNLAAVRVFRRR